MIGRLRRYLLQRRMQREEELLKRRDPTRFWARIRQERVDLLASGKLRPASGDRVTHLKLEGAGLVEVGSVLDLAQLGACGELLRASGMMVGVLWGSCHGLVAVAVCSLFFFILRAIGLKVFERDIVLQIFERLLVR